MPHMSGAQALARQLQIEGVDTIFTLPGVQIMTVFDAIYELQPAIRLIHTRHEQATTYMADGYARVTGKAGVAMVVPGPGALNASAGLGTAYAASSPVLLISGQIISTALGKRQGQLHEIDDQLDVFKPITKWNHRVIQPEEIPGAVREAMRQLQTGRPRPVELEIPPDTLAAQAEIKLLDPETPSPPSPDPDAIQRAAQLLTQAEKPVILAGGGTIIAGASREVEDLATWLQAPVMTTPEGKGILPEDHPLAVGVNFAWLGPAYEILPESDLVLAIGTRFLLRDLTIDPACRVIHIDIDPTEIGKNVSTDVGIVADAKDALAVLLSQLRATSSPRPSRQQEIARYKDHYRRHIRELGPEQVQIVETIRRELAEDAIVVSGMTSIGYWSHLAFTVCRPRTYITSSYFGTLGYAFPTALGAKLARSEKQVVAICGDGGFMYNPQELSTALRHQINVVTLVFNNRAFGASRWDQTHRYGQRFIGTDLLNPDFVKLAEAFGATGMRTTPEDLGPALREALQVNAPVILEVVVPNMMPPFQIVR